VDDDLVGRAGDEDDDLQQVAGAIWADDKPPIGVLAEVINDERVGTACRMSSSSTPVASSRSMDLHTSESYYEIDDIDMGVNANY
jgi:hypothetical protein